MVLIGDVRWTSRYSETSKDVATWTKVLHMNISLGQLE